MMRINGRFAMMIMGLGALLTGSCSRDFLGEEALNLAPETYLVTDTIIRFGDDRLESEVTLQWWGDDEDGFVTGYEFTFDEVITDATIWQYTESQDSTFILAPPPGEDSADFVFHIRAIDNHDLADPTPAALTVPVKNSPPAIIIIPGLNTPKKSFPALRYYWESSDPDGAQNLSHVELFFNDTTGTPYILPSTVTSAIFQAQDPTALTLNCEVFANGGTIAEDILMNGLMANAWNKLYVRAVDQSNAKSAFAIADSVFVKQVHSTVLLVNGYSTTTNEAFYMSHLSANGIAVVDTMQIFESVGGVYTQQSADNLTQGRIFAMFDAIIWFSNNADNSFSLAQKTTESFFNNGGKMLMSVYISSSFDPLSNFLDFTPIASLVNPVDTTLILDLGASLSAEVADWPDLQGTSIVGVVKPINLQIGATPLYTATLTAKDNVALTFTPWTGVSTVMASKTDGAGQTNFVISTLELNKLDGLLNMDSFFEKVMIDEFGF
ncbi:MAG TPA: hypothetical protein PK511_00255 [Chitinophagales bacterium]|nr:hypothetical protein [Chitinophagales bacterium]